MATAGPTWKYGGVKTADNVTDTAALLHSTFQRKHLWGKITPRDWSKGGGGSGSRKSFTRMLALQRPRHCDEDTFHESFTLDFCLIKYRLVVKI